MSVDRFVRRFQIEHLEVEGRTVDGRIVPYDDPARIVEADDEYDEVFTRASLAGMFQGVEARGGDWAFVRFNLDHEESFDHRIGYATDLRSEDDGAYATFELYESPDLPKVRSMLDTSHRGLSIEFGARSSRERDDGTLERLGVHIFGVAATPMPAYAGAVHSGVRLTDEQPALATPRLDEQVARWGFDLASSAPDEE